MSKLTWQNTRLYKAIQDRKNESISALLHNPIVMDAIEDILNKGGSTPKDFTLHDGDHSYRVAEKMWELIPEQTLTLLSNYELLLLLLSAYLHDIGMSPDFDKVKRHEEYLTGRSDTLDQNEINALQKWIDNNDSIQSTNIRDTKITDPTTLNHVLSYYIRSRHNDWSGDWIKENLTKIPLPGYIDWVDDLIILCKSHHEGLTRLLSQDFDPKPVDDDKTHVHLRYLAMCLRVADVMENDPERTPDVILQHRSISNSSLTYWIKDKQFTLTRDGNKFSIYARPSRAYIHKAIEETATWIENELKLCHELIKLKPLQYSVTLGNLAGYTWELAPLIYRDIVPNKDAYIYMQGGFRPNAAKILELLGGNQLYGDPKWAYRELIQNSFDAIKERIAYEVVNNNMTESEITALRGLYSINIRLEQDTEGYWLICKDNGVGMTKGIIEKYFLESGSSKRHEIRELERRCEDKNFHFRRTGQFGIGVLSYFMIAEKIILETKRAQNTGYHDHELIALRFEINGTHDFGELMNCQSSIGTVIKLKLRSDITLNINKWDDSFQTFLKEGIQRSPCRITYTSLSNENYEIKPGWTNTTDDIKIRISQKLFKDISLNRSRREFISEQEKEKLWNEDQLTSLIRNQILETIDFLTEEGTIEGLGTYRAHVPYFKLAKGNCLFFLSEIISPHNHHIREIRDGHFWSFSNLTLYSLKGVNIKIPQGSISYDAASAFIEVDIEELGDSILTVSRHELNVADSFYEKISILDQIAIKLINQHNEIFKNCYSSINNTLLNLFQDEYLWLSPENRTNTKAFEWKKIQYPIAIEVPDIFEIIYKPTSHFGILKFNGKNINSITSPIKMYRGRARIHWDPNNSGEYILAYIPNILRPREKIFETLIIQTNSPKAKHQTFKSIQTPNFLNEVLFYTKGNNYTFHSDQFYMNAGHPLYKLYNEGLLQEAITMGVDRSIESLKTEEQCFAFLLTIFYLKLDEEHIWVVLCEQKQNLMQYLFERLKINGFLVVYDGLISSDRLQLFSSQTIEKLPKEEFTKLWSHQPDPSFLLQGFEELLKLNSDEE